MNLGVSPIVLSSLFDVIQIWNVKIWIYPKYVCGYSLYKNFFIVQKDSQ